MKKLLLIISAAFVALSSLRADTSHLLIQGPFGPGGSVETYKWKVLYEPGSLEYGVDLLTAVFGAPVATGNTFSDIYGGTYDIYRAGTASEAAIYYDYFGALFTLGFTLNGINVQTQPAYNPGWNYYLAGGGYASGAWAYADDGINTRAVIEGSFDGWVFGSTGEYETVFPFTQLTPPDPIVFSSVPGDNEPLLTNFANATVVPEPAAATLLGLAAAGLLFRRRRG